MIFWPLPVVDEEDRLLGIVTVDDVMDVITEEATEDFSKMAAIHGMEDLALSPKEAAFHQLPGCFPVAGGLSHLGHHHPL